MRIGVAHAAHLEAHPGGSDRPAELWAVTGDLAFPLARTATPGRWPAVACLRRGA